MKSWPVMAAITGMLLVAHGARPEQQHIEWLSVSTQDVGGGRVIAFDLKASDGSASSLPNVPRGWFLSITNDASGMTEIRGNAQVGAAALDAGYFTKFVGLQRQSPAIPISNISLEVVVTTDFINERHIAIPVTGLLLSQEPR